ncbi:MAG: cytidine deaminase [Myxococcota bacterium]
MTAANDANALVEAAREARARAYAPYSHFRVGAAVETAGGVFSGANVENASYGLSICAERIAVALAAIAGQRAPSRIAIVSASSPPAAPCGACVQTLLEFVEDLEVILANDAGERRVLRLREIAPHGFRPSDLG